jgi:hypothetical protein
MAQFRLTANREKWLGGVEKRPLGSPSLDLRSRRRTVTEHFEWADETCNPSVGCDEIAPKCERYYSADVLDGDREQG